jgi:hypothetical protein
MVPDGTSRTSKCIQINNLKFQQKPERTAEIRPDRQTLKRKCITSPSRTT